MSDATKEFILWITIAFAVNSCILLCFMYSAFRLLHWGMDYIGLPPAPPRADVTDSGVRQASEYDSREVVYMSEEDKERYQFIMELDGYIPWGKVN